MWFAGAGFSFPRFFREWSKRKSGATLRHFTSPLTTEGHRRFLTIMVAIFGSFKTKFSGRAILPLPRKTKSPAIDGAGVVLGQTYCRCDCSQRRFEGSRMASND